jgi:hypothetical protein
MAEKFTNTWQQWFTSDPCLCSCTLTIYIYRSIIFDKQLLLSHGEPIQGGINRQAQKVDGVPSPPADPNDKMSYYVVVGTLDQYSPHILSPSAKKMRLNFAYNFIRKHDKMSI